MAALTAEKQTPIQGDFRITVFPLKTNAKVWQGGFASVDTTTGFLVDGADTASTVCVGLVLGQGGPSGLTAGAYDSTGLASGTILVPVAWDCEAVVGATGAAQTQIGSNALLVDDQTVQTAATTNSIKAGKITQFISATQVVIFVAGLGDKT